MKRLTAFFLFFLLSPIISHAHIDEDSILHEQNFFLRDDGFQWDLSLRDYSSDYLGPKNDIYSKDLVLKRVLKDGYPLHFGIQDMHRKRLERHVALGAIIPKFSFKISVSDPQSPSDFLGNLLGFLNPGSWFKLINARRKYKIERYLFLTDAIEQYTLADRSYLEVHRQIENFEILNFYLTHLKLLLRHVDDYYTPRNHQDADHLQEVKTSVEQLENRKARARGALGEALIRLARIIIFEGSDWTKFNIEPLSDLPTTVQRFDPEQHDAFIEKALSNSFELKTIRELVKISKKDRYITASNEILSTKDNKSIGFAFGYDTVPKILISQSNLRTQKINLEQTLTDVLQAAELVMWEQNKSYGRYLASVGYLQGAQKALDEYLDDYIETGNLTYGLHHTVRMAIDSQQELNNAIHQFATAIVGQRQLEIYPILDDGLFRLLPSSREIVRLEKWLSEGDEQYEAKQGRHLKKLMPIEDENKLNQFIDRLERRKGSDYVCDLLSTHFGQLLRQKRTASYFQTLDSIVGRLNIELSKNEKKKLEKKCQSGGAKFAGGYLKFMGSDKNNATVAKDEL